MSKVWGPLSRRVVKAQPVPDPGGVDLPGVADREQFGVASEV